MLCPNRKHVDGSPKEPTEAELNSIRLDPDLVQEIRSRLSDISWWMRLLCQHVGQRANRETKETGKFWESRFKAVRLLDETALLACVSYVDLNPIRATLAESIETSDFTSAKQRLESLLLLSTGQQPENEQPDSQPIENRPAEGMPTASQLPDRSLAPIFNDEQKAPLGPQPSSSGTRCSEKGFLNMTSQEYLALLDWTARQLVPGKAGATPCALQTIFERVSMKPENWVNLVTNFGSMFHNVAGRPHEISRARSLRSKRRFRTRSPVEAVFQNC
jgi:hypothetical protein